MPRIFDNIDLPMLPALRNTLNVSERADFCVGYFNLRGWRRIDSLIEAWPGGEGACCRLLVGMQKLPQDELRSAFSLGREDDGIDQQTALRLKKRMAEEFKQQLTLGAPTDEDEAGLRRLSAQIKAKKVVVKLYLRYPLHAKLYLLHRQDPNNPVVGFVGSSNLTLAGLCKQGELNVDVLDHDACRKLQKWFDDRWEDRWCLDISGELAEIIDNSWAREEIIPPYHIYLKIAYHLSQEARAGLAEFQVPEDLRRRLFPFQTAAVKIAAQHLTKRGGVLIGDVVGLGKTLMATALVRVLEEDDDGISTLIICPKNLVKMWQGYVDGYGLRAKVISISVVERELPMIPARFRRVLIDESHNLRNREGGRYKLIQDYIRATASKVILLSATPYNKTYLDLSSQLRLFLPENSDIGTRPERLLRELGEIKFKQMHQCPVRSLAAFEKSEYPDDWRELMRLFLVRRTRSFIQNNYAETDAADGRKFLTFEDGRRSYFPTRVPRTIKFEIDEANPEDQYARLYAADVVDTINALGLPRYGLGNYINGKPEEAPTPLEAERLQNLSRAGKRLMGFCRTNLFKRLESSGKAFLQSLERHVLRNYVFLHAIENGLPLPIGTQDAAMLDSRFHDDDVDTTGSGLFEQDEEIAEADDAANTAQITHYTEPEYQSRAAEVYADYAGRYVRRFKWLRPGLFDKSLGDSLRKDGRALLAILHRCGEWQPEQDSKLCALLDLVTKKHPAQKVLLFTQFADTAKYLEAELLKRQVSQVAGVTGEVYDPTAYAWRFSPVSNGKAEQIAPENQLRVLLATDVLSEGQNLQDAAIVVNYDLPWAIIRLVQRAGRVDRIGQQSQNILCYSFLPAEGVERIIRLRERVRQRLTENAEVVGTDEAFFEDDENNAAVLDLYNEKAGILDGDADTEVDLSSYAYQIWKNATDADPRLLKTIPALPPVAYSTRSTVPASAPAYDPGPQPLLPLGVTPVQHAMPLTDVSALAPVGPEGVLVYLRTAQDNDALAWVGKDGKSVTESQFVILKAAECLPDTLALPRDPQHHQLVQKGVELIVREEKTTGGQLGRPSGARYKVYERLKFYSGEVARTLLQSPELLKAIDDLYRYPLRSSTADTLNRRLKAGITDEALAEMVINLRADDRLCQINDEEQTREPQIICSLGLSNPQR